jgi:hypothetical protein
MNLWEEAKLVQKVCLLNVCYYYVLCREVCIFLALVLEVDHQLTLEKNDDNRKQQWNHLMILEGPIHKFVSLSFFI